MAKPKKFRAQVSEQVTSILEKVHIELRSRNADNVDVSQLIDIAFERVGEKMINEFVSENTPLEYKCKALLADPDSKKRLLEIAETKTFGLNSSDQLSQ